MPTVDSSGDKGASWCAEPRLQTEMSQSITFFSRCKRFPYLQNPDNLGLDAAWLYDSPEELVAASDVHDVGRSRGALGAPLSR